MIREAWVHSAVGADNFCCFATYCYMSWLVRVSTFLVHPTEHFCTTNLPPVSNGRSSESLFYHYSDVGGHFWWFLKCFASHCYLSWLVRVSMILVHRAEHFSTPYMAQGFLGHVDHFSIMIMVPGQTCSVFFLQFLRHTATEIGW